MKNRLLKYILSYLGIGVAVFILTLLTIASSGYSLYERERTAETVTPISFWSMILLLIYFVYRYMKLSVEREREELAIENNKNIQNLYKSNPKESIESFSGKSINEIYKEKTSQSLNDWYKAQIEQKNK